MSHEPTILHADLDAFYASVEQRDDPRLRGRPVVVGPGVVLAASYEARAHGVRSAMGATQARRLCPDAVVVEPRWSAYIAASRAVFEVFERTAPVVEKLSIDEAFLDVRGLQRISGSPPEIAARLRRDVREEVGLPLTVGVACTRVVAKMASGAAKPDGLLVVPAGGELAFLHPLEVEAVWGVGPATARRLHRGGITTVGEAARVPEDALVALLGRAAGRYLHAVAHNREPRRGRTSRGRRSFGAQSALGRAPRTRAGLESVLVALVERVTRRMRAAGRSGRTMILRLRFDDFARASRSLTLARPTAETRILLAAARELLAAAMPAIRRRGVTLLGVTVTNLDGDGGQLLLPFDGRAGPALDAVLDELRDRFGAQAIVRAALVGRGAGLAPWKSLEESSTPLAGPRRAPRRRGGRS